MIPAYLLSACADKTSDFCRGCNEAVKQDADSGRWFITMGHAGFNNRANNTGGFATRKAAERSIAFYNKR